MMMDIDVPGGRCGESNFDDLDSDAPALPKKKSAPAAKAKAPAKKPPAKKAPAKGKGKRAVVNTVYVFFLFERERLVSLVEQFG